jgi:hypothetical protein
LCWFILHAADLGSASERCADCRCGGRRPAGSAAFFTIVTEYSAGHGELTRAELSLLRGSRVAPAAVAAHRSTTRKSEENTHGQ